MYYKVALCQFCVGGKVKKELDIDSILLTRREFQIMKVVWDKEVATANDIYNVLSYQKATAYTTVLTFLRILEKKGAVSHTRSGRTFLYWPLLTREQATWNHMRDSINHYFDGCPEKLMRLLENVLNNGPSVSEQLEEIELAVGK
jgi:BlaI family transcriptional regulator, penicillinase repressor